MTWSRTLILVATLALGAAALGAAALVAGAPAAPAAEDDAADEVEFTPRERRRIAKLSPLPPPPPDPTNAVADDPAAARLGRRLFFETRFSANGAVSCATCHDPAKSFGDGKPLATGLAELTRHTPPLWNVAQNRWYFWDGRADSLWAQALVPIEHPLETGGSRLGVAHVVHGDPVLRSEYEALFGPLPELGDRTRFPAAGRPVPDEPEHAHHRAWLSVSPADRDAIDRVFANLGKAIGAYERRLVRAASPFDEFAAGLAAGDPPRTRSLPPAARRGLKLFLGKANCLLCHFGPNFSDGEFHSTGVPPLGGGALFDSGRYEGVRLLKEDAFNAAGPHSDAGGAGPAAEKVRSLVRSSETWGQFKTPSLRNVAETAPYMHQGQFATLEEVLRHYSTLEDAVLPSHHQEQLLVPLDLTDSEIADLAAFLRSLTGRRPDPALLGPPDAP